MAAATDLDTLKVGMFGSLKRGVDWLPSDQLPTDENPFIVGIRGVADTRAIRPQTKGKEAYANRLYDDYLVDNAEKSGFKDASGNPITTIDQVRIEEKEGRFYGKNAGDSLKTFDTFKGAVKELRKSQFTKKLAAKQASTKKDMNTLQKGVTAQTQAELDVMAKVYAQKKDELQKRLQAAFEEQKKQFLINREHNSQGTLAQYKTIIPSGARGPVDLPGALERVGADVIGTLPKPRETRKRHRFIHLLVTPSKGLPPQPEEYTPPPFIPQGTGQQKEVPVQQTPKQAQQQSQARAQIQTQADTVAKIKGQAMTKEDAKIQAQVSTQADSIYPPPGPSPPEGYNYLAGGGKRKTKRKGKSARKNIKR